MLARKSTSMVAEGQKSSFCVWNLALCKLLETLLSHESACSVYEPRTARMLASKSTLMTWPKANEQILSLELYAAHTIKNFTFSLKRLFKIQTTQSHNACV